MLLAIALSLSACATVPVMSSIGPIKLVFDDVVKCAFKDPASAIICGVLLDQERYTRLVKLTRKGWPDALVVMNCKNRQIVFVRPFRRTSTVVSEPMLTIYKFMCLLRA